MHPSAEQRDARGWRIGSSKSVALQISLLDEAAKQSSSANAQIVDSVKAQMNAFNAAEITHKLDNLIDAQKAINNKMPKPEAPAAAARNRAKARDSMDSGIRYP